MKTQIKYLAIAVLLLAGCAHSQMERDLDAKLADEPTITKADLPQEAEKILAADTAIPETQKKEIRDLWTETRNQMDVLQEDSVKLRALLVKEVISESAPENVSDAEVVLIKLKLTEVEHQRLSTYFSALRKTNKILGRWGSAGERERFYDELDFSSRYIRD